MPNIWNRLSRFAVDDPDEELRRRQTSRTGEFPGGVPMQPIPATAPAVYNEAPMPNRPEGTGRGLVDSYPTYAEPTGSRKTLETFEDERGMPADVNKSKKKGWWRRLADGLKDGYENFDPSQGGGIIGLGANVVGTAIDKAASPRAHAEMQKTQRLQKIWNKLGQDAQVETLERQRQAEEQKIATDGMKAMRDQNKSLYESITADDVVTPEEAARATAAGYPTQPYDARRFDTEWVNGKPMTAAQKGLPIHARNPTLPDKIEDVPRDTTIETGGKTVTLPLKPGQAASTLVQAQERAERAAQRVQDQEVKQADKEYDDARDYQKDVRSWTDRQQKAKAQKAKASAALPKLRESREQLAAQQFDTSEIDRSIATMEGDIAEAGELLKEKKPERIMRKKPADGKGKKLFSPADIDRVIQGR